MKKVTLTLATVLIFFGLGFAQDNNDKDEASHAVVINIKSHALVDVESEKGEAQFINLSPEAPKEAGLGLDFSKATDNSLWLNYSSIVKQKQARTVSVSMKEELPKGVELYLAASKDVGEGKGKVGDASAEEQKLSANGVKLVTGIGSCYTGNGYKKGHNLKFSLKMDEDKYGELITEDYKVEVIYTITGN